MSFKSSKGADEEKTRRKIVPRIVRDTARRVRSLSARGNPAAGPSAVPPLAQPHRYQMAGWRLLAIAGVLSGTALIIAALVLLD